MDILVQILIPDIKVLDNFDIQKRYYVLDGVEYEQEPVEYAYNGINVFRLDEMPNWIERFLSDSASLKKWTSIMILPELIDDLANQVNDLNKSDIEDDSEKKHLLEKAITLVLNHSNKWILIFALSYDQIDTAYRLNTDQCIEKLKENLLYQPSREGFIAVSNNF